ncbi:MAG: hypothetical protein C3F17_05050 [Bradyrhizobiaceae bacterium]|nr:MAG: hypothetical protein C3F17_05050 [Bradyrhizobiaceae bacterium]
MGILYGVVISELLGRESVSVRELETLREQVRDAVGAQGDLVAALNSLDAAIAQRGGGAETSVAPGPRPPHRYWHIGTAVPVDAQTADRIAERLKAVVMDEIARIDTGGDLVATPLAAKEFWGFQPGLGGSVAGFFISSAAGSGGLPV